MIRLAKKKHTCQISQGLITGLMTVLKTMSLVYCTIQDLFSLSTLKDQFSLLFFYAGNCIVSGNELIMSRSSALEMSAHEKKKKNDWNPVTKEMV